VTVPTAARDVSPHLEHVDTTPARVAAQRPSAEPRLTAAADWALALYRKSVLKQAKFRRIESLMDDPAGRSNLDVGADNGVISYLLRRRGGEWRSADLDPRAVASIRQLVGEEVYQLDGARTPFADRAFDQVVIVDYLEHIADDRAFAEELARILKPGGIAVINVPHLQPRSPLNRFRHRIGLTDEWHGHLRPGYSAEGLRELLGPRFAVERAVTYSRFGSEVVDTALNGIYEVMRKRSGGVSSIKGTVVTEPDVRRYRKQFRLLSLLYPALRLAAWTDRLLPWQPGHKLIVRARRLAAPAEAPREDADVDASTDQYARRFEGPVGSWFLEVQTRLTLAALAGLPRGAAVLDVGGGHAQLAPPLIDAGYRVTVVGSDRACGRRLEPWTSAGRCAFEVADLHRLPYADQAFDAVLCYRLLAHSVDWRRLIGELCRVAARRVIVDYPSRRSVNIVAQGLFGMKQSIEGGTTRRYAMYGREEVAGGFEQAGFRVTEEWPQFLLPMALYRLGRSARLARAAEWPARALGLTRAFGSPVIARADRGSG
jgi:ubiquinone/menaquinone biosynthesis C-methylase UbiE